MLQAVLNSSRLRSHWTVLYGTVLYGLHLSILLGSLAKLSAEEPLQVEHNLLELANSRQTLAALNTPAIATFEKRPLGECLASLSEAYRVTIWTDRRVDRSALVTIVGAPNKESPEANTTLGRLRTVAQLGGADAGLVENIVYVGPADQVGAVQLAAVRLHNEMMAVRSARSKNTQAEQRALAWEELTTPADLLTVVQEQWSVKVHSKLPHDLMHAGKLPPCTLATQLTLLHAGFDKQVMLDSPTSSTEAAGFKVSPLTKDTIWQADYAPPAIQSNRLTAARKSYPAGMMQTRNNVSTITGPTGFHLTMFAPRTPVARSVEPKFILPELRAPIERIVGDFAKHLGMEVQWSESIPAGKRQTIMTFEVTKAKTPDEILAQLSKESGLKIQREDQTLFVSPADAP